MLDFEQRERETGGVSGQKSLEIKERINNKLYPHAGVDAGIWTRTTLLRDEYFHHCANL